MPTDTPDIFTGPDGERGIVLVVDQVLDRGWFRSQIRALPHFLTDDRPGFFRAKQLSYDRRIGARVDMTDIWVERDVPVYLVCRGRRWRKNDAIPPAEILYRYEP
ncbi:MAG: hypothetical protein AAF249_00305 [Pseudomonadota bacterium]